MVRAHTNALRIVFALALLLGNCSTSSIPPRVTITLLSTNDFHGGLESNSTDRATGRPIGGAEFLAVTIDRERARNPGGTLVLDGGDIYIGTALSQLTRGRSSIDLMNLIAYDAAAIGNHEFDWGVDTMVERIEQAEFPLLCANVVRRDTGEPPAWASPYHIEERHGVRIAIIGLITESTPRITLPENVAHLDFPDAADVANKWIEELVPSQADLAILLCHIGGYQNQTTREISGSMVSLAERVQGEAAVVGGHTHRLVAGITKDGTALIEAGDNGRWVARADLIYDRASSAVVSATTEIITVFSDDVVADAEVASMLDGYRSEVAPVLNEVLGTTAVELSRRHDESPIGNLLSDVQRFASEADFAFQNPGGIRASIAAGPITFADVYRVMPFDNTIVMMDLSGEEVKTLLEQAVGDGGFLHVSGLSYVIDYDLPVGKRITSISLTDDSTLDPTVTYSVAVNNFMAQGGDDLPVITERDGAVDTGILVRDALADWIRHRTAAGEAITAQVEGRIDRGS